MSAIGLATLLSSGCQTLPDPQRATRTDAESRQAPATDQLEVDRFALAPAEAVQGIAVEALVQYTVVLTAADADVKVSETYTLVRGQDAIQLSRREVTRQQGTHNSTLKFTLPRDLDKGEYTLVTTISDGKSTRTARAALRVI